MARARAARRRRGCAARLLAGSCGGVAGTCIGCLGRGVAALRSRRLHRTARGGRRCRWDDRRGRRTALRYARCDGQNAVARCLQTVDAICEAEQGRRGEGVAGGVGGDEFEVVAEADDGVCGDGVGAAGGADVGGQGLWLVGAAGDGADDAEGEG